MNMAELTAEHTFFLSTLSAYINCAHKDLSSYINQQGNAQLFKKHQLTAIFYYQTRIPELQSEFAATSYYYTNRKKLLAKIDASFHENNIPYILFKGTEIAKFYPIPSTRSMGDSDILVHLSDKTRAHEALLSLSLTNQKQGDMEWVYNKNEIEFELHHRLLYDEVVNDKNLKEWTDTVWEHASTNDGIRYTLELEYHLVYLIIHLRKHFLNSGVGFRQFMDLAVVAKQELDWDKVSTYLTNLHLLPFAQTCYALIERWFGVTTPVTGAVTDEFYESATEKIFSNGVFGFDDDTNRENQVLNSTKKYGKFGHVVLAVFPTYKNMCNAQSYSFLKGRPYLLPVAWIYRWFYVVVKRKAKAGISDAVKPYAMKKQITERDVMLKQWGLL